MTDITDLQERYAAFIDSRGWDELHTPKNVADALTVEAGELQELFLWHDNVTADRIAEDPELRERVREELADVVIYALSMCIQLDIDLVDAVEEKMAANEERYDEERAAEVTERVSQWRQTGGD